jgi:hypothetical protein
MKRVATTLARHPSRRTSSVWMRRLVGRPCPADGWARGSGMSIGLTAHSASSHLCQIEPIGVGAASPRHSSKKRRSLGGAAGKPDCDRSVRTRTYPTGRRDFRPGICTVRASMDRPAIDIGAQAPSGFESGSASGRSTPEPTSSGTPGVSPETPAGISAETPAETPAGTPAETWARPRRIRFVFGPEFNPNPSTVKT